MKMTNGEFVSMKILEKICERLDCDFGDIVHYEKKIKDGDSNEYSAGLMSKLFWLQNYRKQQDTFQLTLQPDIKKTVGRRTSIR